MLLGNYQPFHDYTQTRVNYRAEATHPDNFIALIYTVRRTSKIILNDDRRKQINYFTSVLIPETIKSCISFEKNPLPAEYEWMLEKIKLGTDIFGTKGKSKPYFLSEGINIVIMDTRRVEGAFSDICYSIHTHKPIYKVYYTEYSLLSFSLIVSEIIDPVDGVFYFIAEKNC